MNLNHFLRFCTLLLVPLLLSACSQKYQDVSATLNEAIFGFDDINKSKSEILSIPYASTYVTIDDGAQVFMLLALAEPSESAPYTLQLKWLSSDYGMLVTENGRIIKTLKLPKDNLANITNLNTVDPLSIQGKKPNYQKWIARYDWQPNYRYGFTADVEWRYISSLSLSTPIAEREVNYYQEKIHFSTLDKEITNHYWLDKQNHRVIKSIQYLGPNMPKIEMTILKPYLG